MTMNLNNLSADQLILKARSLRRTLLAEPGLRPVRVAVLGGSTADALVNMLEVLLLSTGFAPVFHQTEYGRYYEDAVLDASELVAFQPDVVYVHTSCLNVPEVPPSASQDQVAEQMEAQLGRFRAIWDALDERIGCQVIQNNFELPPYALFGNMDATVAAGQTRFLTRLNEVFAEEATRRPRLLIQDVHRISAQLGLAQWFDWDRYWSYKELLQPAANVALARSLNALIGALYGKTRKVLVLDLDNTLWGGVIGDDGVEKIQIGRETPVAEAYTAIQQYCLRLRERGVLLAVCSKNNEDVARSGFAHPSSVLKLEHISCFKANWSPKHENIEAIARELNLGVDSFVFIDDNPAERAIVEAQLPSVAVPDVGGEVSRFAGIIEQGRYFEPASLSKEDLERAALYAQNAQRVAQEQKFANYGEYLDSLEMTAEIGTFRPVYIERIAQLTNKSNQYNLTTRRYTIAEIEAMAADPAQIALYGILIDRFGDNGLITVVSAHMADDAAVVDLWLMSCRVLKRDMEHAMLDVLCERARALGATRLEGAYLPTKKNAMVADHYARLGFMQTDAPAAAPEGATYWTLALTDYKPQNNHIRMMPQAGN